MGRLGAGDCVVEWAGHWGSGKGVAGAEGGGGGRGVSLPSGGVPGGRRGRVGAEGGGMGNAPELK